MKTVVVILLVWVGTLFLPWQAGSTEKKNSASRLSGITIYTDLENGIRFRSPNMGFDYRFHPNWSISAETGISLEGWLLEENQEIAGHNDALQWPEERTGKRKKRRGCIPLQRGKLQVEWWPFPETWTGYLEGGLRWDSRSGTEFRLGLGWDINITRHLVIKLEISAELDNANKPLHDCTAIKLGYRF